MPASEVANLGVLELITNAGIVVQLVLLLLVFASVLCWAIILAKFKVFRSAARGNSEFLGVFWKSKSLDEIYSKTEKMKGAPVATVFKSGFKELQKLSASDRSSTGQESAQVENIERSLVRATNSAIAGLERHLGWLASTASAAPFIGLFGTVWGIMNSFQQIGVTGSANLAVVAPGISEALIATAVGLAAAIPAVVAYNHFVNQIKRLAIDIECFSQDFLNIVQRGFMAGSKKRS